MRPAQRASAVLFTALLLPGCASTDTAEVQPTPSIGAVSTHTNELYADFVDCPPLPTPTAATPPPQMVVPDGMVITEISEVGPLQSASGFIDATPIDLRDTFSARDDVELVYLEDEGFEAEILVDTGEWRTFIKATIRCRTGSQVTVLLGPDDQAEALPVPGQLQGG